MITLQHLKALSNISAHDSKIQESIRIKEENELKSLIKMHVNTINNILVSEALKGIVCYEYSVIHLQDLVIKGILEDLKHLKPVLKKTIRNMYEVMFIEFDWSKVDNLRSS